MELTTEQRLEAAERHIAQLLEKDKSNREEIGAMKKRLTEAERHLYSQDERIEGLKFANDFVNAKAETSRGRINVLEIMLRALIGSRYIHNKVSEYAGRIMATMSSEDEIPDVLDEGGFMSLQDYHDSISDIDKRLTFFEERLKNGTSVNLPDGKKDEIQVDSLPMLTRKTKHLTGKLIDLARQTILMSCMFKLLIGDKDMYLLLEKYAEDILTKEEDLADKVEVPGFIPYYRMVDDAQSQQEGMQ